MESSAAGFKSYEAIIVGDVQGHMDPIPTYNGRASGICRANAVLRVVWRIISLNMGKVLIIMYLIDIRLIPIIDFSSEYNYPMLV